MNFKNCNEDESYGNTELPGGEYAENNFFSRDNRAVSNELK